MRQGKLLVAVVLLAINGAEAAPVPGTSCNVLPADNIWNTDISGLPVHARSAAWLSSMSASTAKLHPDFGAAPYGMPFIAVDNTHAKVSLSFTYADESDAGPYPFDGATPIEGGASSTGDRHALMTNRDTCVLFELYDAHWSSGGSTAGSGAIFDLASNALRPAGWTSTDAAGLPVFPGLVRYDELQAGAINHAIRVTAVRTDRSYLWPARHQAGAAADANLPPMGARFRLKAGYDISQLQPQTQVVLNAMKRYGLFLADNGSNWFFQGTEDARWSDTLISELKSVPASQFEAVDESSLMLDANSGQAKQVSQNGPAASFNPTALIFGSQTTGSSSAVKSVALTNSGNANLHVTRVTLAGANAGDFAIGSDGCTSATLIPGASCSVGARFAPSVAGARGAALSFADDAASSPQTVALSGTGVAPAAGIALAPTSIAFGKVKRGQQSAVKIVTVTSTGSANLQVLGVSLSGTNPGDFQIASNSCANANLPSGASCSIGVRFKPGAIGNRSARLNITDNAVGSPHAVTLSGSGSLF